MTLVALANETLSAVRDSLYSKHQMRDSDITLDRIYVMLSEFLIEVKLREEQDKITRTRLLRLLLGQMVHR